MTHQTHENRPAYTISAFCEAFGLSRSKTYQLIQSGQIAALKVGRRTLILREAVEAWLASLPSADPRAEEK